MIRLRVAAVTLLLTGKPICASTLHTTQKASPYAFQKGSSQYLGVSQKENSLDPFKLGNSL